MLGLGFFVIACFAGPGTEPGSTHALSLNASGNSKPSGESAGVEPGSVLGPDGYRGSSACETCHPKQFASWHRTWHSTMTQLPSAKSVLGRFDGRELEFFGERATPIARDGEYFMKLPAYAGKSAREAQVALCVGSHRYQQYFELVGDAPGGAYQRLPLVWHVEEKRWMHVNGIFLEPDSPDWGAHASLWNENCIFCHNTAPAPHFARPKSSAEADGPKHFASTVAEYGIACEACHGPSDEHVRRRMAMLATDPDAPFDAKDAPTVDPRELDGARLNSLCGQCHSQRLPAPLEKLWTYLDGGPTFRPGDLLAAHVSPITRDTPSLDASRANLFRDRFWSDGTARLSAYEYLGVTQSPCAKSNEFSCTSCHSMHVAPDRDVAAQMKSGMDGDRACTQCHAKIADDVSAHTHHAPNSSGSRCLECHMPRMVYGILSIHRSHRVESPNVKRDVEGGRPNACTECHAEMSPLAAADAMRTFWGAKYERPSSRPGGAPLEIADALASLHSGDAVERAVYAERLGRADLALQPAERDFVVGNLIVALGDGYPSIRILARRSLVALDRALEFGLAKELDAFDPFAAGDVRKAALDRLLARFEKRAGERGSKSRAGTLVAGDGAFRVDLPRVVELLNRQSGRVISIGE